MKDKILTKDYLMFALFLIVTLLVIAVSIGFVIGFINGFSSSYYAHHSDTNHLRINADIGIYNIIAIFSCMLGTILFTRWRFKKTTILLSLVDILKLSVFFIGLSIVFSSLHASILKKIY